MAIEEVDHQLSIECHAKVYHRKQEDIDIDIISVVDIHVSSVVSIPVESITDC